MNCLSMCATGSASVLDETFDAVGTSTGGVKGTPTA